MYSKYVFDDILVSPINGEKTKRITRANIKWIRPKGMFYIDEKGLKRRYYPDFLLTDYDIYLDPKNDYLIPRDTFKINSAMKTNNCKIVIVSYDNINAEFVHSLIRDCCL